MGNEHEIDLNNFSQWAMLECVALCKTLGQSRTQVAAALNVSATMISFWTRGHRPIGHIRMQALFEYVRVLAEQRPEHLACDETVTLDVRQSVLGCFNLIQNTSKTLIQKEVKRQSQRQQRMTELALQVASTWPQQDTVLRELRDVLDLSIQFVSLVHVVAHAMNGANPNGVT